MNHTIERWPQELTTGAAGTAGWLTEIPILGRPEGPRLTLLHNGELAHLAAWPG